MTSNPCPLIVLAVALMGSFHAAPPEMAVNARMRGFVESKEIAGALTLVAEVKQKDRPWTPMDGLVVQ